MKLLSVFRRTGQTLQLIKDAVALAHQGYQVYIVVQDEETACWFRHAFSSKLEEVKAKIHFTIYQKLPEDLFAIKHRILYDPLVGNFI